MMKVIGIHYGHNCTIGLSIDGNIVCMLSEERLCRIKNATGFPRQALNEVVETYLEGDFSAVDIVSITDGTGSGAKYCLKEGPEAKSFLDYYWKNKSSLIKIIRSPRISYFKGRIKSYLDKIDLHELLTNHRQRLVKSLPIQKNNIKFFDHHLCHAASAACFEPINDNNEWLVFTLDGEGDDLSSSISIFKGDKFKRISSNSKYSSLGYIYSETTAFLGMKSNEHEFKLMGMAPYADSKQVNRLYDSLKQLISLDDHGEFKSKYRTDKILPFLAELYTFERFDVISGAVQKLTEQLTTDWIKYWINKTGIERIALSGGVFMNVKAVKKASELNEVKDLFIVPSASDESLPLGAIWLANNEVGIKTKSVGNIYLGRSFSQKYVEDLIQIENLHDSCDVEIFNSYMDANTKVAELLSENEIIARCCGREEWGARALGNRSILCNPSNFQNIERLNNKIKSRDFWMPFTPSILKEDLDKYILNPKGISSPYMSITFESTDLARKHFSAAVHPRDKTMRPQSVIKEWNPSYYDLIERFKVITGIGGLLNTSFNLHGEPNVSSPDEAIRTLFNSGLNFVLIENVLLRKIPKKDID